MYIMYLCKYVCMCIYVNMYIYICVCIYVRMYIYIYTHPSFCGLIQRIENFFYDSPYTLYIRKTDPKRCGKTMEKITTYSTFIVGIYRSGLPC